nr:immunoglobulin heavy chain junction region [Macaca mulatta]MOX40325.1 immunoglobulin heavy chain junction region [Macaca mulatta]MOX40896.1 immunoglobulin heavy chain junction region [Macaca mulatta]MOX41295.1 immunoglobulin heavy chain junction region [Macaca mulatta]
CARWGPVLGTVTAPDADYW